MAVFISDWQQRAIRRAANNAGCSEDEMTAYFLTRADWNAESESSLADVLLYFWNGSGS